MYRYTVMKPHIFKDTHSESRRLRNPTFNLLREHSSTIDQQAAMLQVKLLAMGKLLFVYRNLTISSYRLVCLVFRKVRNKVNPWENILLKNWIEYLKARNHKVPENDLRRHTFLSG